ncbi:SpoIIE family protein phosphatase [Gracilimonas sp.]|uniref:SpoIIE family protein phosphatase n=1 Tax=Gracilimonas sp. TaxID=1974203 RepID=UPI0028719720|nr:SpoIIE family protein phosphatase [Gracilimonas sp.]
MTISSKLVSADQVNLLMELVSKINSNLELDNLLLEIMNSSKQIMESEASSLFLLSDDGKELKLTVPTGPYTAEISGITFPADKGISGWVVQNKESVVVHDVQNDPRFGGEITNDSKFKTEELACVPLINHNGEVIGALQAINNTNGDSFSEELLPIFQTLANQAAIAIENSKLQQQRIQNERHAKEMEVARTIQSGFWPDEKPDIKDYSIAGVSNPAQSVGGDYYDYIHIPDSKRWGFTVADVSGKGVPGALLMATLRACLRSNVEHHENVSASVQKANKLICKDSPSEKFITAFYGELNPETHTFNYVNAGHNNPFLLDPNSEELIQLEMSGIMLGVYDSEEFEEYSLTLEPGQKLVLFSDGIPEALNTEGEFFSDQRFEQWLIEHRHLSPHEILSQLLDTIEEFTDGEPQSDDITIVILGRDN